MQIATYLYLNFYIDIDSTSNDQNEVSTKQQCDSKFISEVQIQLQYQIHKPKFNDTTP